MDASRERRVCVATCWASTRVAVLDAAERYEDSFAVTQEFREWTLCLGQDRKLLERSVLMLPAPHRPSVGDPTGRTGDELLET
jgi:hypothetical protein